MRKDKFGKDTLALLQESGNPWKLIAELWPSVILLEEEIQHSLPPPSTPLLISLHVLSKT